jgi:glycosyltransferase involved in cell wall biosynthesis
MFRNYAALFRADICFFWFGSFRHLPYLVVARLFRKPIVIVAGGYDVNRVDSIGYGPSRGVALRRFVFNSADKVLAVSEFTHKSALLNLGLPAEKVETIPLGFEFSNTVLKPWNSRARQVAFLISAPDDMFLVKGVDRIPEICRSLPEVRFKLAGILSPKVEAFLRSQNLPNLELLGWLQYQGEKFVGLLNESRVVCAPSRMESFGAAAFDGASYGCIPVAFSVGALPELLSGIGRLVSEDRVDMMANAIQESVDQSGIDVNTIRGICLDRFSIERRKQSIGKVLGNLIP